MSAFPAANSPGADFLAWCEQIANNPATKYVDSRYLSPDIDIPPAPCGILDDLYLAWCEGWWRGATGKGLFGAKEAPGWQEMFARGFRAGQECANR